MSDQETAAASWREAVKRMRTVRALCDAQLDPRTAGETVDRLKTDALVAAANNADHSEAGRAAAAGALRGRGAAPVWHLRVPGFITAAHLARGERLFFGAGRLVRKGTGLLTFLALAAMFIAAFVFVPSTEEALRAAEAAGVTGAASLDASAIWWDEPEMAPIVAVLGDHPALARSMAAQTIGFGFGIAFGLSLIVWLIASALRRKPARLLLLRKFNVRMIGDALSNMIATELRPYGHVLSLSDKHIRRSRFAWLGTLIQLPGNPLAAALLIIGLPIRFVWRLFDRSRMGPALVTNARDYRNLARRLRDRIGLNLQVATTRKEAFLVRTSDAWWRMVVRLFMDSADAIVVDLSQVTEGTAWELDLIREEDAAARCVFIALIDKHVEAQAALRKWGFAGEIHFYARGGGMLKRMPFRAAMMSAMRATHGSAA